MTTPWIRRLLAALLLAFLAGGVLPVRAAPEDFPEPAELQPAVRFWIRVYTEIDSQSGFLHDDENLSIVYDTLKFDPDAPPVEREAQIEAGRDRYRAALRRIADAGDAGEPLSPEDQRIRDLWGDGATPGRLRAAADHVRFQLGQADHFRQGLLRSGQWQAHIEQVFADTGLPPELGVLPHVESSFNPAAWSKVGAAGLWQFMRGTGRRYLRIDAAVDDRLDPFRSTQAAAQLLSYNYRLLGTWPLALTAYNHGAEGMRRAKELVGTDDIVRILREYHSPTFGFASRNFYVSFLAALTIERDPEQYFGPMSRYPQARFQQVRMPFSAGIRVLAQLLRMDPQDLRDLNPALLPAVWQGRYPVPRGYLLRLPVDGQQWSESMLEDRLTALGPARDTTPRRHGGRASRGRRGAHPGHGGHGRVRGRRHAHLAA